MQAQAKAEGGTIDDGLSTQVRSLEDRLASLSAEHEREIRQLTDRAVAVTTTRTDAEEQLAIIYTALGHHIDALVPRFWSNPAIVELAHRVGAARSAVATAGAAGRRGQ